MIGNVVVKINKEIIRQVLMTIRLLMTAIRICYGVTRKLKVKLLIEVDQVGHVSIVDVKEIGVLEDGACDVTGRPVESICAKYT